VGTGNSLMTWVDGLIMLTLLAVYSVNQRLPSGPATIAPGPELGVGVGSSAMLESGWSASSGSTPGHSRRPSTDGPLPPPRDHNANKDRCFPSAFIVLHLSIRGMESAASSRSPVVGSGSRHRNGRTFYFKRKGLEPRPIGPRGSSRGL